MSQDCGGCEFAGRHKRWCPEDVGPRAARAGMLSEVLESMGDSLPPAEANVLYRATNDLHRLAIRLSRHGDEETNP